MSDKKKSDEEKLKLIKGAIQKMISGGHCEGGGTYCAPDDDSCTSCWRCDGSCEGRCDGGDPNCTCSNGFSL